MNWDVILFAVNPPYPLPSEWLPALLEISSTSHVTHLSLNTVLALMAISFGVVCWDFRREPLLSQCFGQLPILLLRCYPHQ